MRYGGGWRPGRDFFSWPEYGSSDPALRELTLKAG